jgi:hypothetical protein
MWYDRCSRARQRLQRWEASSVRQKYLLILCATLGVALSIVPAHAQQRPFRFGFGQWFPYPGTGIPPMRVYPGNVSSLRIQVSQRDALVYVDGYAAGLVDDYDGAFQRLQLVPGHHEIVVYLEGHRTLRQNLYLNPRSTHTIKHTLLPLGPGEPNEAPPVPRAMSPMAGAPIQGMPAVEAERMGTLALRVQPADASVYIDGELWRGPQGQDRLILQIREGAHRVRVEKPGFQSFVADVDVRARETLSFSVSLVQ